jgi:hypothetical protein
MRDPLYAGNRQQQRCAVDGCTHPAMRSSQLCALHRLYPVRSLKRLPDPEEESSGLVERVLAYIVKPQPFRDARGRYARRPPW